MSFPLRSMQMLRRSFLIMAGMVIVGVRLTVAQTPQPEGSDAHPSDYQHPLRTWEQAEPHRHVAEPRLDVRRVRESQATTTEIMGKLRSIMIPHVEFRRTSLLDAVKYLRQESRRLDPDPNPDNRGINIFLKIPKSSPPVGNSVESVILGLPLPTEPSASPESATGRDRTFISLTMDRLPLLEALKYVASQARMEIQVGPYAVSIVPLASAIPIFVTTEYRVSPELLGLPADMDVNPSKDQSSRGGQVTFARIDIASQLESKGVTFPPGAVAVYLPSLQKLIVRNTQENLDKVAALISVARETPTPTNP